MTGWTYQVGTRATVRLGRVADLGAPPDEPTPTVLLSYPEPDAVVYPGFAVMQVAPVWVRWRLGQVEHIRSVPMVGAALRAPREADLELVAVDALFDGSGMPSEAVFTVAARAVAPIPPQDVPVSLLSPATANTPRFPIPAFAAQLFGERQDTAQINMYAPNGDPVRAVQDRSLVAVPDWATTFGVPGIGDGTYLIARCFA